MIKWVDGRMLFWDPENTVLMDLTRDIERQAQEFNYPSEMIEGIVKSAEDLEDWLYRNHPEVKCGADITAKLFDQYVYERGRRHT